jgi:GGDEF domain-containing protein
MTDPTTGLPSSRLIEEQLRGLMKLDDWAYVQIGIDYIEPFNDAYGFVARDEVMRFTGMFLNEIVDEYGTLDDFIGHASSYTFVLITMSDRVQDMVDKLRQRFNEGILAHYNFMDREQGGIMTSDGRLVPIMRLSAGIVSSKTQRFSDIREITETAAELRRLDKEKQDKTN